jgi:hypothetical protein
VRAAPSGLKQQEQQEQQQQQGPHSICHVDNGRVLGFDNAHDYHHRHYMGEVTAVEFISYEATLETFQQEWLAIVKGKRGKTS